MHKKDRPMLSVTSLLINSPTSNNNNNPILFQQNNNNNHHHHGISSVTSPNGISNGNPNGMTISSGSSNGISATSPIGSSMNLHQLQQQHNPVINSNVNSPGNNNAVAAAAGVVGSGNISSSACDNNNNNRYPPNHPLSGSKHLCAICEDRASGKHYGVYSCEGCKGFFKRTVRKDLTYICRDDQNCIVDKRQRNRCQYCRYQKCLEMGMKREAVQEERQRNKPENEPESSTNSPTFGQIFDSYQELNIERLTDVEKLIEITPNKCSPSAKIATKEIELLFRWIQHIPYFQTLHKDDQLTLLKSGWNELLIAEFSYRSTCKNDALLLANGHEVSKQNAQSACIGDIFGRVLNELVQKMRKMNMDQSEIGCLRAIVLFNPAIKNLRNSSAVEKLRDRVYSILENHCRTYYRDQTSRFAKLLVRLPALRSIGLKCVEHLFFQQFLDENNLKQPIENFILQMLKPDSAIMRANNHLQSY